MRNGRWSSGGRPSEIIGFSRVGAGVSRAVFDIMLFEYNVVPAA